MAREKKMKFITTFRTTTMAMKMEQCAKEEMTAGRLIPVPRQISAGCGMAWSAPLEEKEKVKALIEAKGIETEGEFELLL